MTLLTLVLLTLFVGLGRWQWLRGEGKQAVWSEYERDAPASNLGSRGFDSVDRFARLQLNGEFEAERQFLLDNRSHAGKPGYEVLTPFRLADGRRLLVNRGWIPFGGYRDRLPDVSMPDIAPVQITGRIDELPSGGLASGHAAPDPAAPWPKLTSFPTHAELANALAVNLENRMLLLDAGIPGGYVREWSPPGMPPTRHFSYAIQWWGFAGVLLVLYFGLNFRKVS
ncbi:MAG TPA: SURF1 family protein [Steroidobacteraceae bacterium]|nr:SURF1 family protein [Steroidobacteraceae bacterium]